VLVAQLDYGVEVKMSDNKIILQEKLCSKCKNIKSYHGFNKKSASKDNLSSFCKECNKEYMKNYYKSNLSSFKEYQKEYNKDNIEQNKTRQCEYYKKNKDKVKQQQKEYYLKNIDKCNQMSYRWRQENRDRYIELRNKRKIERYKNDINYKLKNNMISRTNLALKDNRKSGRTEELLGCTIQFLKKYLESQFVDGMSWDNRLQWHIDHIIPCDSFDLSDPDQQKLCFHYTNLQPLWAVDNLKKSSKLDWNTK
jgi:hypothetical protein